MEKVELIDDTVLCPQCLVKTMTRKEEKNEDCFMFPIYILKIKCACGWKTQLSGPEPFKIFFEKQEKEKEEEKKSKDYDPTKGTWPIGNI